MVMHILLYRGTPIAAAEDFERLSMFMVNYTAEQQAEMAIVHVEVLT